MGTADTPSREAAADECLGDGFGLVEEGVGRQGLVMGWGFGIIGVMETVESEGFDPITIAEFERRLESVKSGLVVVGLLGVGTLIIGIVCIICIFARFPNLGPVLGLIGLVVFLGLWFYVAFSQSEKFYSRHGLCCPGCNDSLYRDFVSYKSYIRSKDSNYYRLNTFVSGECHRCRRMAVEPNEAINRYLERRSAARKANKSDTANFACLIVGVIILLFVVRGVAAYNERAEEEEEAGKNNIYSARQHLWAGEFHEAKEMLVLILKKEPNYGTANERLGFVYLQQDNYEKALDHYRKALPYSEEPEYVKNAIGLINERMTDAK